MAMARRTWNIEDTNSLIEKYEANPMLWDVKCEEYRNRQLKSVVLTKIASQFKCTEEEIQRKLQNLRNQVSQELNKIKKKKSGSGTDEVYTSTWPYFSALKFLIPGLINRSSTSNVGDKEEDTHGEDTHGDENNDKIQETGNTMHEQSKRTMQREKVENKGLKRKYGVDDANSKVLKQALDIMQKEPDENDRFGEYVAMELKSSQSDLNERKLKSKIRRPIARIADEDDLNYSSSVSMSPYPSPRHYPMQSPSPYFVPSPSPSPSSVLYQQPPGTFTHNTQQHGLEHDQTTSNTNTTFDKNTADYQQLF